LLKRMVEDYDGCYFMYVWWLSHDKYIFCTWSLFPFNGSSYFSNDFVMLCAGLHCALSNVGLYTRMWAMIVSFIFTTSIYLL
jgi:hypothetical protein